MQRDDGGEDVRRAVGAMLFERFEHGVLVTDAAGTVIEVNGAARRMIDEADGLVVDGGRIAAYRRNDTLRLRERIADLAARVGDTAPGRPAHDGSRASLLIGRRGGRKPYALLLWGERLATGAAPAPSTCVIGLFVDLAQRSVPDPAWLQEAFGLTGREASLCAAITDGEGLASAAQRLGVSVATARSHLASVFLKTETRRQAELTRLVCETAPLRL